MDVLTQGIITLLRSGLTGERLSLPDGFDLEQAMKPMYMHQIQSVCYIGAVNCGLDKSQPAMQKLFQIYCGVLQHCEKQERLLAELLEAFDRDNIDYMPLKGVELRRLYPSPELRSMGDADILIRMEQYPRITGIMQRLGYQQGRESDHELLWKKDVLIVELHKRLVPSNNRDFCAVFGDGWQMARLQEGTRYAMSREDTFVYLFTHFTKHYRDGGVGCRQLVDLWLYLRACELDMAYTEQFLKKLGLLEFYGNIRRVLCAWFEDGRWDDKTQFITSVILRSGSWGDRSSHILASVSKERQQTGGLFRAKIRRLWKLTFLPLMYMKQKYPVLEKAPVLLPFFWIVRLVKVLFFTKGKLKKHVREYDYLSQERTDYYEQSLHYVGLDFDVKE
ncbi:MAG: nucleotidyltransferase family protein [Oscillospiraceae bacterium]|nr:nucleotidyltransferase family protein [Oscillospiraceae bacterium]